jgi:hypothetical protein
MWISKTALISRKGSALLIVLAFAAGLAVIAPIVLNLLKGSAQNTASGQEQMTKILIARSVDSFANNRSALLASYRRATTMVSPKRINTCFNVCVGGGINPDLDEACAIDSDKMLGVNPLTGQFVSPLNGAGLVPMNGGCSSRDASGAELWHQLTLYHPVTGEVMGGPDPATAPVNDARYDFTTGAGARIVRYRSDGQVCATSVPDALCPFEVMTLFHPVCPGDTYRVIAPPTVSQAPSVAPALRETVQEISAREAVSGTDWLAKLLSVEVVKSAHALPASCLLYVMGLDGDGKVVCGPGGKACPDNVSCYQDGNARSFGCCCYNLNCAGTDTRTGTDLGLMTDTGSGTGTGTGTTVFVGTGTVTGSGTGTGTGTLTLISTGTGAGTGTGTGQKGAPIPTCGQAESIMVWTRVGWNPRPPWDTQAKAVGARPIDSRFLGSGRPRLPAEITQTPVCGGILKQAPCP